MARVFQTIGLIVLQTLMIHHSGCFQNAWTKRMNGILKFKLFIYQYGTGQNFKQVLKESVEAYNQSGSYLSLSCKRQKKCTKKSVEGLTGSIYNRQRISGRFTL
jgi:hypothetical protein